MNNTFVSSNSTKLDTTVSAGPLYLHEVVRPLHLGHEVLHYLLSDHWVTGWIWRAVLHSNSWFCSQLGRGLVLEGIHHLFKTQTQATITLEYINTRLVINMY